MPNVKWNAIPPVRGPNPQGVNNAIRTSNKQMVSSKKVVIQSDNITQKQWSNLILELNLMRKAWKPYAKIQIVGRGVKKIVKHGTKRYGI